MIMTFLQKFFKGRLYPWFVVLAGILFSQVFIQSFIESRYSSFINHRRIEAISSGSALRGTLEQEIGKLIYLSSGLAAYLKIHHSQINPREIQSLLAELQKQSPMIRNLGIARKTVLTYVHPRKGNELAIGLDYRKTPDQWPQVERAIRNREGILSGPLFLRQGGRALIYRVPVFIDGDLWGIISTVIDSDTLFQEVFDRASNPKFRFAVFPSVEPIGSPFIYGDPEILSRPDVILIKSQWIGNDWTYAVLPRPGKSHFDLFLSMQLFGAGISLLIGGFLYYFIQSRRRITEIDRTYRLVAENAADVVWVYNITRNQFTFISPSVKQLRGYTPEEAMAQTIEESLTEDSERRTKIHFLRRYRRFLRGDTSRIFIDEYRLPRKDGSFVWIETTTHYRKNEMMEDEVLGIARNIDRRKMVQEELQTANSMKNRILAIIGHDLRGPLGTMDALIEAVLTNLKTMEPLEIENLLTILKRSTSKSYVLLENLLLWAKSQSGSMIARKANNDLVKTAKAATGLLTEQAQTREIGIVLELPDTLAAYYDNQMIETVIRNLASNAIKFTPNGGEVLIRGEEKGERVLFSVSDSGPGYPEDLPGKLERKEAIESTFGPGGEKGSGLGLLLCQEFLQLNDGELQLERNPAGGSTFLFSLPQGD